MTPPTVQEDSANKMWPTYMKEATEYDKHMTDGWKEGAMGPLVFVCIDSLICAVSAITILLDRSFLHTRCDLPR
jgi:Family of unknown function (DUF6535)